MLTYTLKRGFLQWMLNDVLTSVDELKKQEYYMTVNEYSILIAKAKSEYDKQVSSSIIQVLTLIYKIQFNDEDKKSLVLFNKLTELYDSIPYVPCTKHGICFNIDLCVGNTFDASNIVMTYFDEWFGDKSAYPVEGKVETKKKELNKVGYLNNPKKWDASTKFGLKRIQLIKRLIDELAETR